VSLGWRRTLFFRQAILLTLLCAGCTRGIVADDSGDNDDTGQDNDLPDPLTGLEATDECDNLQVQGCPFGAATTYVVGDYTFSGTDVTGFEYWRWIPNDTLAGQSSDWEPDTPCTLVWQVSAERDDDPECSACLYQLSGSVTFDGNASDCALALEGVEGVNMELGYDVRAGSSGDEVRMFFTTSTNEFPNGYTAYANERGLVFTWPADCALVGATDCR
jgi:hypothetical protein